MGQEQTASLEAAGPMTPGTRIEVQFGPYELRVEKGDAWLWLGNKNPVWIQVSKDGDLDITVFHDFPKECNVTLTRLGR